MKKIYCLFAILWLAVFSMQAQLPENRTVRTVVADALAQLPAQDHATYVSIMNDLLSTGEEGIMMVINRMLPPGEGNNIPMESALSGLAGYVKETSNESSRLLVVNTYLKGLESPIDKDTKAFLIRQLEIIEGTEPAEQVSFNVEVGCQQEVIRKLRPEMLEEEGFISLFNGYDLTGWKGLVGNPITRSKMTSSELKKAQKAANKEMHRNWKVENGAIVYYGSGYDNLCTENSYDDFEMYIDWMLDPEGHEPDGGIYLRGTPQVQIWDVARTNVGAEVGSGGLYNNQVHSSKPIKVADKPLGEWNTFYIKMVGDRVTVGLNGELVTDNVILENYWNRNQPIPLREQIELQAHGCKVYYKNIYLKELPSTEPFMLSKEEESEGFQILFDGTNMFHWQGNTGDYTLEDGVIALDPGTRFGGNLYTKQEYGNFVFRFEFQLTPGANNGVGIRTPMDVDAAYHGMEIQVLDHDDPIYSDLADYQVHGSVYGVIPAERKGMKPIGEWNYEEIVANGDNIKVTLNGIVILDGNIRDAAKNGTMDGQQHPGLFNKKGYIGFLGHGSHVKFRNIRIKELD